MPLICLPDTKLRQEEQVPCNHKSEKHTRFTVFTHPHKSLCVKYFIFVTV